MHIALQQELIVYAGKGREGGLEQHEANAGVHLQVGRDVLGGHAEREEAEGDPLPARQGTL